MKPYDVAIAGGGPAGLAVAITAAQRGLSTVVVERGALPVDKACGEGLMPAGLEVLERLGARALLDGQGCSPFVGIRYVQEDGSTAEGVLPAPGGLGVRRVALASALGERARAVGVELRERTVVQGHRRTGTGMVLETSEGRIEARFLVGADGLGSPLRRAEGLEGTVRGPQRFGMRQHFKVAPWTPFVEVHFASGVEAYVTPAGAQRVGLAFLWENGALEHVSFEELLAHFPTLHARLGAAEPDSKVRGAGPLERSARARVADRFALVGDAAGYVDAVTGEGLSLAFTCAEALGQLLPEALVKGASREVLLPYERTFQRAFRKYAWMARALLVLARRPRLRAPVVRWLGRSPWVFERLLGFAVK
ncbi:Dehydrogenase (flavoprotein) [Stigmatella aurantiaca]|uniref:Dehydrogenase (Flavoprotein) n=1 Tax=Stigmatella aurantiaca TaxID=41 RepID=A0A1H7NQF5_STIAU|nr:NAD(P)/FAD-dependent oxidoreductase [Stigmatella aurantiaca]SEL25686.1 Dehydrogenase (flavoprotein) [Stigmatella aurantiaca]